MILYDIFFMVTTHFDLSLWQGKFDTHDILTEVSCLGGRNGRFIEGTHQALRQIPSKRMVRKINNHDNRITLI